MYWPTCPRAVGPVSRTTNSTVGSPYPFASRSIAWRDQRLEGSLANTSHLTPNRPTICRQSKVQFDLKKDSYSTEIVSPKSLSEMYWARRLHAWSYEEEDRRLEGASATRLVVRGRGPTARGRVGYVGSPYRFASRSIAWRDQRLEGSLATLALLIASHLGRSLGETNGSRAR